MFKPFVTAYQTDCLVIPFVFKLSIIIKPDIMNKYETELKLKETNLYSSANQLVAKEIDIGFVALTHI